MPIVPSGCLPSGILHSICRSWPHHGREWANRIVAEPVGQFYPSLSGLQEGQKSQNCDPAGLRQNQLLYCQVLAVLVRWLPSAIQQPIPPEKAHPRSAGYAISSLVHSSQCSRCNSSAEI